MTDQDVNRLPLGNGQTRVSACVTWPDAVQQVEAILPDEVAASVLLVAGQGETTRTLRLVTPDDLTVALDTMALGQEPTPAAAPDATDDLVSRLRAAAARDGVYDDPPWWWDVPDKGGPAPLLREAADRIGAVESILRKLVTPEREWEQHYVDLKGGVFDVRVELTDDEVAYLRRFELPTPSTIAPRQGSGTAYGSSGPASIDVSTDAVTVTIPADAAPPPCPRCGEPTFKVWLDADRREFVWGHDCEPD